MLDLMIICFYVFIICYRYISVEFASIWRGMGADVNLCFRKELPLRYLKDLYSGFILEVEMFDVKAKASYCVLPK